MDSSEEDVSIEKSDIEQIIRPKRRAIVLDDEEEEEAKANPAVSQPSDKPSSPQKQLQDDHKPSKKLQSEVTSAT